MSAEDVAGLTFAQFNARLTDIAEITMMMQGQGKGRFTREKRPPLKPGDPIRPARTVIS